MTSKNIRMAVLALAVIASNAYADGHLKATLIPVDSAQPTKVSLTLTNDGDQPISFDKYATPLQLLDEDHTSFNQFSVVDTNSQQRSHAQYRGYVVHSLSFPVSNFITINPGKSIVAAYDLGPDYALTPGITYRVQFNMMVGFGPRDRAGNPIHNELHIPVEQPVLSNVINITLPDTYVASATIEPSKKLLTAAKADDGTLAKLNEAVYYGYSYMANMAWVNYEDGLPPYGKPNGKSIDSPHYATWFGTYKNNDANDKLVTGTLRAIDTRLSQGAFGSALHKISFINGCSSSTSRETAAIAHTGSVATSGVYEIAICAAYWSLPPKPKKGVVGDSQPATLVHEVSHFSDLPTDVTGWTHETQDWTGYAYSRPACRQLVTVDRLKAVSSASNFEYFIEDMQTLF